VAYDLNGNLTFDGLRSFAYDSESQLTNVNVAGQWRSEFVFDGLGRKRIERDCTWTGSTWQQTNEVRFVYDGTLVLQERGSNNAPQVTYTRGLDLSGSRQGAGGIGGLLARTDANGSAYYHSDGAGNVTALMDAQQDIVARYLYDPFGRQLGQWGELANANRMRFSSKEVHKQSGLYYYGFRFYDPSLKRWLTEDPRGEAGGINLYRFVLNSPLRYVDPDGWAPQMIGFTYDPNGGTASPIYVDQKFGQDYGVGLHGPVGSEAATVGMMWANMVPLVGEGMDLWVLGDPQSAWWEKGLAGASLGVNAVTGGLLPNAGGALKGGKRLCSPTAKGFSNADFGNQIHDRFSDALTKQTGTRPTDWRMSTRPGQTGVDAEYIGPPTRHPGFNYAELKPHSPGSVETFGAQLGRWDLPPGQTQLWFYNEAGVIGSTGFNF
jgi:RHS repeat-associated protein